MIEERHRTGLVGLAMAVAIGVIVGGFALSILFWLFGAVFHLLFWFARVAVIVLLATFVVRLVSRRSCGRRSAT